MRTSLVNPQDDRWHILDPFVPEEAMTSANAAKRAGITQRTIINWCEAYGLGRIIAGRWRISRVALEMFLDDDQKALACYLAGDREDQIVLRYFANLNVPINLIRRRTGARQGDDVS